uniref:FYVE-type domain-containing protein n=1 Tax=Hyaloperonospora arabidopsidis (strain Emoy2) TaxID=559515 RepID=M4B5B5_HYAAE
MHRNRSADYSSRGNRRPLTFSTANVSANSMALSTLTGLHQQQQQQQQQLQEAPLAVAATSHGPVTVESRASKRCSVCGKGFNPLRRRHYCRTCTAVVCSSCSISRKVESTFEGAITVRMCVSCKLSSIASQDDFYDRIFSTNENGTNPSNTNGNGSNPLGTTTSDSQLSLSENGDFATTTDRLSFASYSSATGGRHVNHGSKDDGNFVGGATTTTNSSNAQLVDAQTLVDKQRATSSSNLLVRRKSSSTRGSNHAPAPTAASSGARGRHGSFTASHVVTEDCPWCMNEACAPLHEYFEVPYPFFLELADPAAKNQYIAAKHLDNEKNRLRSVRAIRGALKTSPAALQTILQLCNMAAIATSSPMALVGLLDKHMYVPCAETGLGSLDKIDRQKSLAAHACRNGSPLVCSNLTRDVRFAANPWRRDVLQAQFYAGIPLTLSNGHTIGAIEVFDGTPRFACMDVISQLQTVVRGLLRKFEEILAKQIGSGEEGAEASHKRRAPNDECGEGKHRQSRAPAPSAPSAPAIPPPKKSPKSPAQTLTNRPPGPAVNSPHQPAASDEKAPSLVFGLSAAAAAPPPSTPVETPLQAATGGEPSQDEMEMRLLQLLSQSTSTQEQLRNQQGQMVNAISCHSKQITDLAKQLERMESTLAAKLGADAEDDDDDDDSSVNGDADATSA